MAFSLISFSQSFMPAPYSAHKEGYPKKTNTTIGTTVQANSKFLFTRTVRYIEVTLINHFLVISSNVDLTINIKIQKQVTI